MSAITQVVRALCWSGYPDGDGGAKLLAIDPGTMRGAFASVLDGGATDLEIGALMAASMAVEARHDAGWSAEILLGLSDAVRDRMTPLDVDAGSAPVVVLPNYGDEDAFPATPLIALLLRRMGVRVLVHGAVETRGGLFNSRVFSELGILPAATRGQAQRQFTEDGLALLPVTLFSPGLAAMLSLRNHLGIRTPAHALAKMLMPVLATSTRSLHVLHVAPWLKSRLADESVMLETPALIVATAECESRAVECGTHFAFRDDKEGATWQTLFESDCVRSLTEGPGGATCGSAPDDQDPRAWATWTHERLDGESGLPLIVTNLFACCLYGCGYAEDMHHAKAIVAVEPGSLAAA